jgi:hypothetical protein
MIIFRSWKQSIFPLPPTVVNNCTDPQLSGNSVVSNPSHFFLLAPSAVKADKCCVGCTSASFTGEALGFTNSHRYFDQDFKGRIPIEHLHHSSDKGRHTLITRSSILSTLILPPFPFLVIVIFLPVTK